MDIEQTVEEILVIKRMMHAGATPAEVQQYIDGWTSKEAACSIESQRPLYCSVIARGNGKLRKSESN